MGMGRGTAPEVSTRTWLCWLGILSGPPRQLLPCSLPTDICAFCHKAVGPQEPTVEAMRKQYHADCFTCRTCQRRLAGQRYYQRDGRPICDACYQVWGCWGWWHFRE